jgi:hypothetical protein
MKLSPAMQKALIRAARRERRNFCPMHVSGAAETQLIEALDRRGFIVWDNPEAYKYGPDSRVLHHGAPRISPLGFAAIDA